MKRLLLLWILAITPGIGSAVVVYQQNFDSGALGPNLNISATSGFSYDLNGGALNMHMGAGSPNGSISASSTFQVVGDFTATVDVTRTNLANALGIGAYRSGGGGANVFFWGSGQLPISNMFIPQQITVGRYLAGNSASFRIRRSGTTLFGELLDTNGTTWKIINQATQPIFADPLTISLFLDKETGVPTTQNGSFDNLRIEAAGFRNFVPSPATWMLTLLGLALIPKRRQLMR